MRILRDIMKRPYHEHLTNQDQTRDKLSVEENYLTAKTLLQKIHKNLQTESRKKRKNSSHFAKEKAAKNIEYEIKSLVTGVIEYYSKSNEFKDQLRAVKIAMEFAHEYPTNKDILNKELAQLNDQLKTCEYIYNSSPELAQEAKTCIDAIKNKIIPQLYYNYALFFNSELKILGEANKPRDLDVSALTKKQQENIQIITNFLSLYKGSEEFPLKKDIELQLAESYELIADLQFDVYTFYREQHSVSFLKKIISNYKESLSYKTDINVLLSELNSRHLLIKKYKREDKISQQKKMLHEINLIVNTIITLIDFSDELAAESRIELISNMLYACEQGWLHAKNEPSVYIQKALNCVEKNKEFLFEHEDDESHELNFKSILNNLYQMGLNEDRFELTVIPDINTAIKRAEKLIRAQQSSYKQIVDFHEGTLIDSPIDIAPATVPEITIKPEPEISIQNEKPNSKAVLICKGEDLRKKSISTSSLARTMPFFKAEIIENKVNRKERNN